MVTPNNSPMFPRDNSAVIQGQRAAYRWLIELAGDINLDMFDGEMAMRLWRALSPNLFCCMDCGDDRWCTRGLDYWMTGIVIYLLKFYGHATHQDEINIRYLRARYLDSPEDRAAMIDFDLEMLDLCAPIVRAIETQTVTFLDRTRWEVVWR